MKFIGCYSNMPIRSFKHNGIYLFDHEEHQIDKIAAISPGPTEHNFVYISTKAQPKTGLYEYDTNEMIDRHGYAYEEFGLYNDIKIKREELDDNHAVINGIPTKLNGRAELRSRHTSPYNFIIAPHQSPINNSKADKVLEDYLASLLNNEEAIGEMAQYIGRLPKCRF